MTTPDSLPKEIGWIDIDTYADERGTLSVADGVNGRFPFVVERVFWISDVPADQSRGAHAHRTCAEVVVPLRGSLTACLHDGEREYRYVLDNPQRGLYIPPMVWCSFLKFSAYCLCLCLTPAPYDKAGYIDAFEQFKALF